jgi:hypothetical protein
VVCQSHSALKRSWHIVIDGYCVENAQEAKAFYERVWELAPRSVNANGHRCLDDAVYSSFQAFRLLGSQKRGSGRPKVLESPGHEFSQTVVSYVRDCNMLPLLLEKEENEEEESRMWPK